jgi:DNA-binding transcriptional ArsR family regulator
LMVKTEEALERLVSSGRCDCNNVNEYAEQLRLLAKREADRAEAKKRGRFFKALGDETRQRILGLLSIRELCVCELITALNITQPTASHHLSILEDAGLVESRKEGRLVFYGIADKQKVSSLMKAATE